MLFRSVPKNGIIRILPFPGTDTDDAIFGYSHRFDPFPALPGAVIRNSHEFYLFPVLTPILAFFRTHIDSTLFRYSPGQFFDTRTDSTFSRYSPGFYHFWVLIKIRPFSDDLQDSISIVAQILPFPDTYPDSTIFGTHTDSTLFRYSPG